MVPRYFVEPTLLPSEIRVEARIPSEQDQVGDVVDELIDFCTTRLHLESRKIFALRIAALEAVANAVIHGNAHNPERLVEVGLSLSASFVELRVRDQGVGFDPNALPDPTPVDFFEDEDEVATTGRGVFLMRQYMDEVVYQPPGNEVLCRLRLN